MRIDIRSLTIAAALGLALLPSAQAAIDRYEFTVNWNQGELAGYGLKGNGTQGASAATNVADTR